MRATSSTAFLLASALLAAGSPSQAATGGPDAFGYYFVDSQEAGGPTYDWITVTTAAGNASNCDDCFHQVTLPFAFGFYGTNRTTAWIGSNGYLTFDSGDTDYTNSALSSADAEHVAVHACWDDWDSTATASTVTYGTVGASPNRTFVVSWNEIRVYPYNSNNNPVTFQVHLSENDDSIEFHYQEMDANGNGHDNGASGTIGIDNGTGAFLQYSHDIASLAQYRAIRFYLNEEPVADASGPYAGSEGSPVALSAAASTDADGTIALYEWDCGNDGVYEISSTSATGSSCTWSDGGSYTVGLRVTDDDGASDTDTATAAIANAPPAISAVTVPPGQEGVPVTLSVAFSDPGAADTHTVAWNFGDSSSGTGASVSHTYGDDGTYTVTVTVTDDDGGADVETASASIANVAPVIASSAIPSSGLEGSPVAFSAAATDVPADPLSYSWTFGDTGTGSGASVSHTYADDGSFAVTLTVDDGDGGTATATGIVAVGNVPPAIGSMTVQSGNEGQVLSLAAAATDPGADPLTYSWDFGDSSSGGGATVNHAWADQGSYAVTLTVTDGDGGVTTQTATAAIANVAPSILSLGGVLSGTEGQTLSFSGPATDPGADALSWTWDFGDGTPPLVASTSSASHAWADDGSYPLTLTVTDGDGGTDTETSTVAIANVAPAVMWATAPGGDEGDLLSFDASFSDPGADTLDCSWDFGDGSPTVQGPAAWHVYEDDGAYTATLTASDEDGGITTWSATCTIANVSPVLTSVDGPDSAFEGDLLSFFGAADDEGPADLPALVFSWDFGDGSPSSDGPAVDHVFSDEGSYAVTVVVADDDGGSDTETLAVEVANVPPEITSFASEYASEGVPWVYQAVAADPGDDVLTWALSASAPAGMALDPGTGLIQWTPTYEQALAGPCWAILSVDDGDGGTDQQVLAIGVGWADGDSDGMPDGWEDDYGLDPADSADAAGDLDGDGVSNLDEFLDGTDPASFDGPTAPVPLSPVGGEEVATAAPDLVAGNATDPQGDPLAYDFEVYADAAMTALMTSAGGAIPEDASGQTSWKVDLLLPENATFWWRASATDGLAWGPWSAAESFVVNEVNEPPGPPVPLFPVDEETAAGVEVELHWAAGWEPDGDTVTYTVQLWDGALSEVLREVAGLAEELSGGGAWTVDVELAEDTWYAWDVIATDEHGLPGPSSEPELFFRDTSNAPPSGVAFLDPLQDDVVGTVSPILVASEGIDPEDGDLTYRFEVDSVPGFDSGDLVSASLPGTGTGEVAWDLLESGIALPEDTIAWARVRGIDEGGVGSEWDVISFFVAGDDTAPPVPLLLSPEDGAETASIFPTLIAGNVADPEGDLVFYDFLVASDAGMTDVIAARDHILEGSGAEGGETQTSWQVDVDLSGDVFWSARAVDALGAASPWADPFELRILADDGDDDIVLEGGDVLVAGGGCRCDGRVAGGGVSPAAALLLGLAGLAGRRRKR